MIQCGDQMKSKKNAQAEGYVSGQADEILYRQEMEGGKIHFFCARVFKLLQA
jgi:hypothetical protein